MPTIYLILFSILGWGGGSVFYKLANNNVAPLMVTAIVTSVYVLLTPLTFLFIKFDHTINFAGVMYSILGAACMCVGSLGYFYALKAGGAAGETTLMTSMYPVLTLILSSIFLHESLSITKIIGSIFAILGLVFLCAP